MDKSIKCDCGKLIAKIRDGKLYVWCKNCKREVEIKIEYPKEPLSLYLYGIGLPRFTLSEMKLRDYPKVSVCERTSKTHFRGVEFYGNLTGRILGFYCRGLVQSLVSELRRHKWCYMTNLRK